MVEYNLKTFEGMAELMEDHGFEDVVVKHENFIGKVTCKASGSSDFNFAKAVHDCMTVVQRFEFEIQYDVGKIMVKI